ncbi:MAG: hypothetical protein DI536_17135 [Archangium gephyra]|uniref:Uncharacterized protein n=1 Tax=Archangium gephyra TaxID=48 RepID=A0A2W5TFL7_9BACT|nr:MAG: hypothetical protein DI536_17135 [Archangium gephyra]
MQRSYDFVLQGRTPGEPAPLDQLLVALSARGAQLDAKGFGLLKVDRGEATVQPTLENGVTIALDVRVPFHEKLELLESVFKVLVEAAEVSEARLLDPQRNETASHASFSASADEYLRMARYAGEYGGVSEALGLSTMGAQPDEDSSSVRWLMTIAVFLVALYAGWRTVVTIRENRLRVEEEQEIQRLEKEAQEQRQRRVTGQQ